MQCFCNRILRKVPNFVASLFLCSSGRTEDFPARRRCGTIIKTDASSLIGWFVRQSPNRKSDHFE
ncbi:hypothetical protein ACHAXS_008493 [Conticribra weissflogii]